MDEVLPRIVVVGTGQFGKNHVRMLNELGALGAVVDANVEVAKYFGELYRIPWYRDVSQLRGEDYSGAIVATPTVTHLGIANSLVSMGLPHVLIEKPFTSTLAEAYSLVDHAREHGAQLAVGFIERFNQAVSLVAKFQSENRIGKPLIYHATRIRRWPERPVDLGVVKDTSIHDIDILNHLRGRTPDLVYARAGNAIHKYFEDHVTIVLGYRTGERAILEANWLTPYKVRRLTITGMEGVIDADLLTQEVSVRSQSGTHIPFVEWKEPLRGELGSFIEGIKHNSPHSPNDKDGVEALKVAEAVLKSSQIEQTVSID